MIYVSGSKNILSDVLSRLYSNKEPGIVRSRSEYTYYNVIDNDFLGKHLITIVGTEGESELLEVEDTRDCEGS